jgi:hypothetical protein
MKRDAARLAKKPRTPKDKVKDRGKKQGIESKPPVERVV